MENGKLRTGNLSFETISATKNFILSVADFCCGDINLVSL
jgi:hypothetical protein